MVYPTHTSKNFTDQGGNSMVVGGTINVQRGGSIVQPQAFATNGCFFPTSSVTSGQFNRLNRTPIYVNKTSGGRNFVLFFPNFLLSTTGTGIDTTTCGYTKKLTDVAIYDPSTGFYYDVTFNNANGYSDGAHGTAIPVGAIAQSDPVDLWAKAGSLLYVISRDKSLSASGNYLISHYGPAQLGCGVRGNQLTDDFAFTTTGLGTGAVLTANVSAGGMTAPTIVSGGSGYTAGNLTIGTYNGGYGTGAVIPCTVNGSGTITGFGSITAGSGYAAGACFVSPSSANNAFQAGPAYGPCCVLYTPDIQTESMLLVGDSLTNGYNSSDTTGDALYNFGAPERIMAGRYGTVHVSMPGITSAQIGNVLTLVLPSFGAYATKTHLWIATNDLAGNSGLTAAQIAALVSPLAAQLRTGYPNNQVAIQKLAPRTSSTDGWATTTNQTPGAGFTVGAAADQFNAMVAAGWGGSTANGLQSDWTPPDLRTFFQDGTNTAAWRIDQGVFTLDGIHPDALIGLPYTAQNLAYPAFTSLGIQSGPHVVAPGNAY